MRWHVSRNVNHGRDGRARPPEFAVGDANANCPADFQKILLIIHRNTSFHTKNLSYPLPDPFPGGRGASPPHFTPAEFWANAGANPEGLVEGESPSPSTKPSGLAPVFPQNSSHRFNLLEMRVGRNHMHGRSVSNV